MSIARILANLWLDLKCLFFSISKSKIGLQDYLPAHFMIIFHKSNLSSSFSSGLKDCVRETFKTKLIFRLSIFHEFSLPYS